MKIYETLKNSKDKKRTIQIINFISQKLQENIPILWVKSRNYYLPSSQNSIFYNEKVDLREKYIETSEHLGEGAQPVKIERFYFDLPPEFLIVFFEESHSYRHKSLMEIQHYNKGKINYIGNVGFNSADDPEELYIAERDFFYVLKFLAKFKEIPKSYKKHQKDGFVKKVSSIKT